MRDLLNRGLRYTTQIACAALSVVAMVSCDQIIGGTAEGPPETPPTGDPHGPEDPDPPDRPPATPRLFLSSNRILDRTYPVGLEIAPVTLPRVLGGIAAEYSLSPHIPGLAFDPSTRSISGSPTDIGEYAMMYTAVTAAESKSITFHYRVVGIGTTEADAAQLVHASPLRGVLPSEDKVHVFKVVVDRPGDLVVAADPRADFKYNDVIRVHIEGYGTERELSVENAAPGTYYVHVVRNFRSPLELSYNVVAWLVPPAEDSDDFDIEVRYVGDNDPSIEHLILMDQAADYWSRTLGESENTHWYGVRSSDIACGAADLPFGDFIDDVVVHFSVNDVGPRGRAGWCARRDSYLPHASGVTIRPDVFSLDVYQHELAHALGFSRLIYEDMGLIVDLPSSSQEPPYPDTHFIGRRAIEEFNAAGGESYTGAKVPVDYYSPTSHWRDSVFGCEIMSYGACYGRKPPISRITLAVFEDIGYTVDYSLADPYRLPDMDSYS